MEIILIGGPLNGTKKELPQYISPKDSLTESGEDDNTLTYTICQAGDGTFYGVYNPAYDVSVERIDNLRSTIRNAMR